MKIFVPFSEPLIEATGLDLGRLVPFNLDYECVRLAGWEAVDVSAEPEPKRQRVKRGACAGTPRRRAKTARRNGAANCRSPDPSLR